MLVFIIPLKSKHKCKSWSRVSDLCLRTIKSACAQKNQQFQVILVCNESPELSSLTPFEQEKLLVVNTKNHCSDQKLGVFGNKVKLDIASEHDKAIKLKLGYDAAINQFSPTHLMALDADDCVNNGLSALIDKDPACPGWFAQQGYVFSEGSKYIFRRRAGFQSLCGSSVIIRVDLWNAIFRETDGYLFYAHGTTILNGEKLLPVPFPASIYSINNGDNYHMTDALKKQLSGGRNIAKLGVIYKRLMIYRIGYVGNFHTTNFGLYKMKSNNANS